MFVSSPHATECAQRLAMQLGCIVGDFTEDYASPRPALLGSVSSAALTLKEYGGRWDRVDRVYHFASWAILEAALQRLVDDRTLAVRG